MIEQIYNYFTIETIYLWLNIGVIPFWLVLIFFPQSKICSIFIASIFPMFIFSLIYSYLIYLAFLNDYDFLSNFSCPKCYASVDVWHPSEKLIKEYKDHESET